MSAPPVSTDVGSNGPTPPELRRRRLRRILIAGGLTLVALVTFVGVGGAVLLRRFEAAVSHDRLLDEGARSGGGPVVGPLNLLLVGSDLRENNPDAGQRSDTIIIAHITERLDRAYLVSVPRDLLVTIPSVPTLDFPGDTTKINAAFEYGHGGSGGVRLLSRTLTSLVGVRFDGAAVIEFSGLKSAVDLVGGVDMCVDVRTVSIHTKKVFEPGCRLMNSTDALDYLRQRRFPDGDFTRQRHQQQFLKAFFERALSTGVLTNPVRLDAFLRAVGQSLTVDTGSASLPDLTLALRDLRPDNLTGVRIPTYDDTVDGESVVVPSDDAEELFAALRDDSLDAWTSTHRQWVNRI